MAATSRLDDAARAGWLYYVAGNTQDEIARKLGVSRQTAQRLVSLAMGEGLIKVRLDFPIASCLDLAAQLRERFRLKLVEVVPSDGQNNSPILGLAGAGAAEMERRLRSPEPTVMAVGTGRTLKATVEQLPFLECPQHKIVSLTGNIKPDGSGAFYNVIFTMADRVKARSFPIPFPVLASTPEERDMLLERAMIQPAKQLAARADVAFVGIGDLGPHAPVLEDNFVTQIELEQLHKAGAVGEIVGWAFDREGQLLQGPHNARVASMPVPSRDTTLVIGLAMGTRKLPGILGAVRGGLVNGLITDELSAEALLAS